MVISGGATPTAVELTAKAAVTVKIKLESMVNRNMDCFIILRLKVVPSLALCLN